MAFFTRLAMLCKQVGRAALAGSFSVFLVHCAFTEYGQRINAEQQALAHLETRRQKLETKYIILLNNLETHPLEAELQLEKDKLYRKLQALTEEIAEKRKGLDLSLAEWDKKVLEERIQLQMENKEIHESKDIVVPEE